jgi:type IV pilus assembly protein PilW
MKVMKARCAQAGMTLVELMVAMALGAFLITGVINVFLANKDSSQIETSLARLQENGRIALDMLVSDLRDAYYIGCGSREGFITPIANGVTWIPLAGFEHEAGGFDPALPAALNATVGANNREGSDVVYLAHGRPLNVTTAAPVGAASTSVPVSSNLECISQNETVIIATCSLATLFRVTNTPACDGSATTFEFALAGNTPASLGAGFPAGTELMQTFEKVWYVADTGRRRTADNIPVNALFRLTNGQPLEMVEGVEYLQILYGEEVSAGQLRYVPANNGSLDIANDEIVSIRVALLMQSYEPVLDAPDTRVYQVADQEIGATGTTYTHNGDLTLRRVFQTTVLLKN